jgi:hypothetical protein
MLKIIKVSEWSKILLWLNLKIFKNLRQKKVQVLHRKNSNFTSEILKFYWKNSKIRKNSVSQPYWFAFKSHGSHT